MSLAESVKIVAAEQSIREKRPLAAAFNQPHEKWQVNQSLVEGWLEQAFGRSSETANDLLHIVRREFAATRGGYK